MKLFRKRIRGEDVVLGRYANILVDDWFKRTFGEKHSKRLLQLFLQEVIPDRDIADISYAPQEHVNPFRRKKGIRVDVECTDSDGRRFVVEMQLAPQKFFYERAVYNTSFAVQEQIPQGQQTYDFPEVYFIGVMNFALHRGGRVRYSYTIREEVTDELMTDRVKYIFLELPNSVPLWQRAEASVLDKFCYAMYMMPSLTDRPAELEAEIFKLLFDFAEIANFAPRERIKYINDMTTKRDLHNQIEYARDEGREQGREEAMKIIAQNMQDMGMSMEDIKKATGVSL